MSVFNQTAIGYNHIQDNKVCQDYSISYSDDRRSIIATCDGHGGTQYIRSDRGSKFAAESIVEIFKKYEFSNKLMLPVKDLEDKIKLALLCEWNKRVEQDYAKEPFSEEELDILNDNQLDLLYDHPEVAYGTTLHAALILDGLVITLSIGDGGIFFVSNDNEVIELDEDNDENVANITCSLCSEHAFNYMNVKFTSLNKYKAILCVTDGVVNPYQSYTNFKQSFVDPTLNKLKEEDGERSIQLFIKDLGREKGIGDDVSLAMYYNKDKLCD